MMWDKIFRQAYFNLLLKEAQTKPTKEIVEALRRMLRGAGVKSWHQLIVNPEVAKELQYLTERGYTLERPLPWLYQQVKQKYPSLIRAFE